MESCNSTGNIGIMLSVKKTGCSGLAYVMTPTSHVPVDYLVFTKFNASIYVNPDDLPLLTGTIVDFVTTGFKSTITFTNPNAVSECGCGESFRV